MRISKAILIDTVSGRRNIVIKAGQFIPIKNGIAKTMRTLGFVGVSKAINRAKTAKEVERQVEYVLKYELSVGRGGKFLIDPVTRKKQKNPLREKWIKLARVFRGSIRMIKEAEKLEKLEKRIKGRK